MNNPLISVFENTATRIEQTFAPDRELDADIAYLFSGIQMSWGAFAADGSIYRMYPLYVYPYIPQGKTQGYSLRPVKHYTENINDALTLIRNTNYTLYKPQICPLPNKPYVASLDMDIGYGANQALAICNLAFKVNRKHYVNSTRI